MALISNPLTVKCQVAPELLNGRIADLSDLFGFEEKRSFPDRAFIEQLEGQMLAIAREIDELNVTDGAALDASFSLNRRTRP